jgi:hypothetical protein
MKDIMAEQSSAKHQGVATFEYNPADKDQPFLFELAQPLSELASMLEKEFAGETLKMREIFERHHINKPYTKKNYKEILKQMEKDNRIQVSSTKKRRANTFADDLEVTFPVHD